MFTKFWNAIAAQFNKLGDFFREADPVAEMKLEYERALERLRSAREGLSGYRAIADGLIAQTERDARRADELDLKVEALLAAGDREGAARTVVELESVRQGLVRAKDELARHEERYSAQLEAIKAAGERLQAVRTEIRRYDAELKMGDAEAEAVKLMQGVDTDFTGAFAQIADVIEDRLAKQRARSRVASDLSGESPRARADERKALGEELLRRREAAKVPAQS